MTKYLAFLTLPLLALGAIALPGHADSPSAPTPTGGNTYVANRPFQEDTETWNVFIPEECKDMNCTVTSRTKNPHTSPTCIQLHADDFARFCLGRKAIRVQPGERYRITCWVRADGKAEIKEGTPGILLRVGMTTAGAQTPGGTFYIGLDGKVAHIAIPDKTFGNPDSRLPLDWKKIETVIEIPPNVDSLGMSFFLWWVKGSAYIDDFTIDKVETTTPATPVVEPTPDKT